MTSLYRNPFELTRDLTANRPKMGYEDSVYLAKLAEQAERYEGGLRTAVFNGAPAD